MVSDLGPTRVMIVDDQAILRSGIAFSLATFDEVEVVAEANSGEEAILLCEGLTPDVVLMDVRMPGMGGVAATRTIRDTCPATQVVALTAFEEGNLVQDVLQAGAIGCLLKDVLADELVNAVRKAHLGMPVLAPAAAQALVRGVQSRPSQLGHDLTDREREVLALLMEGSSNGSIAERLVVTPATVKFHIRSIRSKLGTSSRTETAVLALQHRLGKAVASAPHGYADSSVVSMHA
jgi:two-component system, NarL family, response regulator LiaR